MNDLKIKKPRRSQPKKKKNLNNENAVQLFSRMRMDESIPNPGLTLNMADLKLSEKNRPFRKFDDIATFGKVAPNTLLVCINPGKKLYFAGKCEVKVLKGEIKVFGATISSTSGTHKIFSPKGYSSLYIACDSETRTGAKSVSKKLPPFVFKSDLGDLGASFIMSGFDNTWCRGVRKYCPEGYSVVGSPLPKKENDPVRLGTLMRKFGFTFLNQSGDNFRAFKEIDELDSISFTLSGAGDDGSASKQNPDRVAVFGGQGVGKSTVCKLLLNKFLSRGAAEVYIVDLDLGQSEFTPPGLISIIKCKDFVLGPNFTHLMEAKRSLYLGYVSCDSNPIRYANGVHDLAHYIKSLPPRPCIINTMGYCTGLGIELARLIIHHFCPSVVIQLHIDKKSRTFPIDLNCPNLRLMPVKKSRLIKDPYALSNLELYRFYKIVSACNVSGGNNQHEWGLDSKSKRNLALVSYFAGIIGATPDVNFLSIRPLRLSLKSCGISVMDAYCKISFLNLLNIMTGNLVALCRHPVNMLKNEEYENENGATKNYKSIVQDNKTFYHFLGYGVVRHIDLHEMILHVVSPIQPNKLKMVNAVISAGKIGLPPSFRRVDEGGLVEIDDEGSFYSDRNCNALNLPALKHFPMRSVVHTFTSGLS